MQVVKSIKKTFHNDRIGIETIKAIYKAQYQLSRTEFQQLVQQKRK